MPRLNNCVDNLVLLRIKGRFPIEKGQARARKTECDLATRFKRSSTLDIVLQMSTTHDAFFQPFHKDDEN